MRRIRLAALAAACLLLALAPAAVARGLALRSCPGELPGECGTLRVPLDRTGAQPGVVPLRIDRVLARRGRGAPVALFAFAGGPGQAAVPFTADFAAALVPALRTRDLVVFDQRGTGASGLLRCPALERAKFPNYGKPAQECAAILGPARAFYTTPDTVEDIDAVRRALGYERITLYGVSYGTKVMQAYALRYPQHVERLLFDSTLPVTGPDPFYRSSLAAMPRMLAALCASPACNGVSTEPLADLKSLVARLETSGPLLGPLYGADGRARSKRLAQFDVFSVVVAGDLNPLLRSGLPAALRSALAGDVAPMLRLARLANDTEEGTVDPAEFSTALYAATVCEEAPLPWARTALPAERRAQAEATIDAISDAVLAPFDRATARDSDVLKLCAPWPTAPAAPVFGQGPYPAVPTLFLEGEGDLRTPIEDARSVAAQIPGATVLAVPDTGHSVLGADLSRCSTGAVRRFFADRPVVPCAHGRPYFTPERIAPPVLQDVTPVAAVGGRAGRTLEAVRRTVRDAGWAFIAKAVAGATDAQLARGMGGLRGGRLSFRDGTITLRGFAYVPGVRISGELELGGLRLSGTIRVSGSAATPGTLRVQEDGSLRGRLAGRDVRSGAVSATAAGAAPATATATDPRLSVTLREARRLARSVAFSARR